MRIHVQKDTLVKALSSIQSATEKKGPPILSHVLIEAESERVKLFATDFDLTLQVSCEAVVDEAGKTTAPARSLFDIAKEFPRDTITLETQEDRLEITAERSSFYLPSLDPSDFPMDQLGEEILYHPCKGDVLKRVIHKTFYAIPLTSNPLSSPGLYFISSPEGTYKFLSCDAFRIARMEVSPEDLGMTFPQEEMLLPRKGVQELLKLAEEGKEVFLGMDRNVFYGRNDVETVVSMRLIEAAFPSFDSIIPPVRSSRAVVPLDAFQQALRRMAIFTNPSWRHVKLTFSPGVLEMAAGNPDIGMGREEIAIEYGGELLRTAFNIKFLSDAVSVVSADAFHFEWTPETEGGFITDPADPSYLALIMPVVSD